MNTMRVGWDEWWMFVLALGFVLACAGILFASEASASNAHGELEHRVVIVESF